MTHHAVFSGYYYDKQLRGVYSDLATAHRAAEICNGTVEPVEINPPISAPDGQYGWSVVSDSETRELKVFRCDASSPSFGDETVHDKTIAWRRPTFRTLVTFCWAPNLQSAADVARARFARYEEER